MSDFESLFLYLSVFMISTCCFSLYKNRYLGKIGIFFAVMIPSLLAGFRYEVGTDYVTYYYCFSELDKVSYNWILTDSFHMNMERGFLLVSKFIVDLSGARAAFGVYSFIIISIFIFTIIKQYEKYNLTLCYLIFLITINLSSYNILRQEIALVILFWGFKYIFNKSIVKYGFIVLVACQFHTTAALSVPLYFLWSKNRDDVNHTLKVIYYIIALIIVVFWQNIFSFFAVGSDNFYIDKYSTYLIEYESNNRSFYLKLMLSVFFISLLKKYKNYDTRLSLFVNAYILGALLEYTGFYTPFVKRISDYYGEFSGLMLLITLPSIFYIRFNQFFAKICILIYAFSLFIIVYFVMNQGHFFSYDF